MSVCAINKIKEYEKEIEQLKREKNYYMKMYAEFNNAFIEGGKKLCK